MELALFTASVVPFWLDSMCACVCVCDETGRHTQTAAAHAWKGWERGGGWGAFCVIVPFVSNLFLYFSVILLITATLPLFGASSPARMCVCLRVCVSKCGRVCR